MAPARNLSLLCLTEAQMAMGTEFEKYLQRYVFPSLVIFGILGNSLNLSVLLNKRMRSRANNFLSLLAICDICFLSLLIPNILANVPLFTFNYYFRWIYFHSKVHLLTLANWFSAGAIYCVIAVCTDRLIGIRNPLYIRSHVASYKMFLLLGSIILLPGIFTFYQHFAYVCLVRHYCRDTQIYSVCLPVTQERWINNQTNPYKESFKQFISVSKLLNITVIIICPIILLTTLNLLLLCVLRQRATKLLLNGDISSKPCVDNQKHHRTEQRVTLTVTLIVTMFTITNGPSAVDQLMQTIYPVAQPAIWYNLSLCCSTLVITGKASNFIVFCLFSKHFRNTAKQKLFAKFSRHPAQSKYKSSIQNPIDHSSTTAYFMSKKSLT
ncbi:G-PROTEIN-RECEP-F1-2 domain-containing protein [Aphelenchoides bicaudatus]|nr:G-PROTEIN-RECEP-F1-2 domain-containing protein [Aphelenchoides bicaudatus]